MIINNINNNVLINNSINNNNNKADSIKLFQVNESAQDAIGWGFCTHYLISDWSK